jgi:hypothetical protein
LTERGRDLVDDRRAEMEARWLAALEGFSDKDLRTAAAVLDRASALFEDLTENPLETPAKVAS